MSLKSNQAASEPYQTAAGEAANAGNLLRVLTASNGAATSHAPSRAKRPRAVVKARSDGPDGVSRVNVKVGSKEQGSELHQV